MSLTGVGWGITNGGDDGKINQFLRQVIRFTNSLAIELESSFIAPIEIAGFDGFFSI